MEDLAYAEPTRGMAAMRMRILRAELLSGGSLAVYNALENGDEVSITAGAETQPRTTSTGALLSVVVSAVQNSTFARSIKEGGWIFLPRDGSLHPLHPTAHRVRLMPRRPGAMRMMTDGNANVVEAVPTSAPAIIENNGLGLAIRNWIWATSTAVASSAAAIVMTKGIHRGQVGAIAIGTLLLIGSSEFTDYPVASTMWNQSEPVLRKVGETTKQTLADVSDKASESVSASLRYLGWLVVGALVIGGISWWIVVRVIEAVIERTRRVKNIWLGTNMQTAGIPNAGNVIRPVAGAFVPVVPTAVRPLSGATSGEDSGEDLEMRRRCQSSRIIYDDNYLRPMNQAVCKRDGILKTDLLHGDCLMMSSGNVVSGKYGRIEVVVCKKHFDVYVERRTDVGCEQKDCYGRGVLVKIGDKAIRECNEHIGLRLLQENQKVR